MINLESSYGQSAAILLAGGQSSRMTGIDKIWAEINGVPVINYAFDWMLDKDFIREINLLEVVIVAEMEQQARIRQALGMRLPSRGVPCLKFALPGARRQDSVKSGLEVVSEEVERVLIHDAARPLVTVEMALRVFFAAVKYGSAVPGIAVRDTVKIIKRLEGARVPLVEATLDRAQLRLIQTPQCFSYLTLIKAHKLCEGNFTDDSAMVESIGGEVAVVEGAIDNIKITYPADLELVSEMLKTFGKDA
ncbi:MAG: 2-C-methyl-D-erythritol 4-phosphate cytidylyltransferase [Chloroflexota bacterium]|nr:2-C-methyl-D-erythritol 4-phosphate cytidylyltransferase [Chloroflexota bacterium]